ncbi:MAG: tRNA (N6-isopentenyl adenosine(37)-C2)-methylthiotransferase MiaB [Bacteriovoracia bacterium]
MEVTQQTPPAGRKYFIQTFGCQMNVADTERMEALLSETGMTPAPSADRADVILVNGCSVREKAVHKAVSALGRFQILKNNGRGPLIGLGGCVGQLTKDQLFNRAPYLDFVFGPDAIDELPEILHQVDHGKRHAVFADFDKSMKYSTRTKVVGEKAQAFVNIMKGCDKYCSYCIVPFTRGREKSRTIDEVVDDVAALVEKGVTEVTLLGQNVNSFGKGNPNAYAREPRELSNRIGKVGPREGEENFPQLLRALDSDPRCAKLKRIRFTSSHPLDFSDQLIECYAPADQGGVAKLAQHLHLPVQSGSNRVLQKMSRHHKIEDYIAQMRRLKELNPLVGISTDLIVGFPTETDEEFQETIKLLDAIQYDMIFAFAYSPRPGTKAAKMEDDVPKKVKADRLNYLLDYQLGISAKRYAAKVGQTMEVLVEGEAKNQLMAEREAAKAAISEASSLGVPGDSGSAHPSMNSATAARVFTGRTTCNRIVNFIASPGQVLGRTPDQMTRALNGQLVNVKITEATSLALYGELALEIPE